MTIRWAGTSAEYEALAKALSELVGGRADVAARFMPDWEAEPGRVVKAHWGPWRGRRVAKDYKALPGEVLQACKNYKEGGVEYRVLQPLSVGNLVKHLHGRERLGVYVLDGSANCKFLAADFDDHKGTLAPEAVWSEVQRFVETCRTHEWRTQVERSKSGRGYHVWLFFDAPVEAAKARALGRWLFEESQAIREGEDFNTFDRFFPAQSAIPPAGKGFGNLIGLPLCGPKEYAAGRTAWIDDAGAVISDALGHTLALLETGRNPANRVDAFLSEWQLSPESAEAYAGGPRDPNAQLGTREEFEAVTSRCKFFQWMENKNNWQFVTEPLWFSWVSNACRFEPGDDYLHRCSIGHKSYDPASTDLKIDHARASSGPRRCKTIQEDGFKGCPIGGCKLPNGKATSAPAGLSVWGASRQSPAAHDRTVKTADPHSVKPQVEPPPSGVPWSDALSVYPETKMPWPQPVGGYQVTVKGVQDHTNQYVALRPLWVDAITRNSVGLFGLSIKFFDHDWKLRTHAIPRERLYEQGGVLGRELAAFGLPIMPGKEKWVARYLVMQEEATARRIRAAGRLGWYDAPQAPAVFVLPDQVLGETPEELVYQPDVPMTTAAETLHASGTLQQWQEKVIAPCSNNPVLMFASMLGLAGPLLKFCQVESGGFHFYGVTTAGKTTAAQVAASAWGCAADPQEGPEVTSIRKWYMTGNALESFAELHNDMLLTLDEISEVDEKELGRIVYQLAGGLSKGRANAGGGLRAMRAWRLLFLSTGEKSVRQMLEQVKQTQKGGQRVRLPDIPTDSDEDGRRAVVEDAHGRDPKEFVQDLKAACAKYYGSAGPTFAMYLIAEAVQMGTTTLASHLRSELREFELVLSKNIEDKLPPEGRRVIRRFALVALAGVRAWMAGVLPWELAKVLWAVQNVRDRWLAEQGQNYSEVDRALAHLRDQVIRHSDRFRWIDGNGPSRPLGRELLGYRVREWYLLTETGLSELCGEHDSRAVLRALKAQRWLWHDGGRLTRKSPKIEELGDTRPNLYWIDVKFLGQTEIRETEEDRVAGMDEETQQRGRRQLF